MLHNQRIKPVTVKLEVELKNRLQVLGALRQRTIHWLMKEAISQYVEQLEKEDKLKQEALQRWQEAEQGKIVSNQAVMEWLDTWGTEDDKGRPACEK